MGGCTPRYHKNPTCIFLFRSGAIDKGLKTLYPAYNSVREEKQKCLPAEIKVTDFTASIDLQNLMDHTGKDLQLH